MGEFKLRVHIPIGGLVSLAIDSMETLLFVTTHSGRGVFELDSGKKVARLQDETYPENGEIKGIAPFSTSMVNVSEFDFENELIVYSKNKKYKVVGCSDTISVYKST